MAEHELWNELGNLYFMIGAYEQAVQAYRRSIQLDERFGRPYSNLALTYVRQGRYREAIDLYRRSLELLSDDREKAASWSRLGHVYRHLKDYHAAILAYQRADELDPGSAHGQEEPGQPLYGSVQESLEFPPHEPLPAPSSDPAASPPSGDAPVPASDAPHSAPMESPAAETLGNVSLEEAETIENAGSSSANINTSAEERVVTEDAPETTDGIESQVAPLDGSYRQAKYPVPFTGRGLSTLQSEQALQEVEAEVEKRLLPTFVLAEHNEEEKENEALQRTSEAESMVAALGVREDLAELEAEIAKFKRTVQLNPRNAFAWDALGTLYKSAGMYREAVVAYRQAISINSTKASYHHHLGLVYAAEGRHEDAIQAFQKVLELDPDHSLAHATLGGYYRKMGLEDLAQEHIGKAMKSIFDSENEYNRACLEAICGNVDQALDLLRVALMNKQTYVDWVLRDPDLDFIRQDPRFKQLISEFTR